MLSPFSCFVSAVSLDRVLKQQLKALLADSHELLGVPINRSAEVLAGFFQGFDFRYFRDAVVPGIVTDERKKVALMFRRPAWVLVES